MLLIGLQATFIGKFGQLSTCSSLLFYLSKEGTLLAVPMKSNSLMKFDSNHQETRRDFGNIAPSNFNTHTSNNFS